MPFPGLRFRPAALVGIVLLGAILAGPSAAADEYRITLRSDVEAEPASGRVILFFIIGRGWEQRQPIEAPFYEAPQPIASVAVEDFKPGDTVVINDAAIAFPKPVNELSGRGRVQAIFDHDRTERGHAQGPGNVYSGVLDVDLSPEREDRFEIVLEHVIEPPPLPQRPNVRWIEHRSDLLSEFYGRDVYHRAGVALPLPYLEEENAEDVEQRRWPAIYVIPGFGGRHTGALSHSDMYRATGIEQVAPMAVTIVLDPESPLGHHGFVDSPNHGPRGTALVKEFIAHLEEEFRLVGEPEARIVTGHSSGGWSSLWLALRWPDVFGACWSSAPDPVDFSAFQMTDLYGDESMFVSAGGSPTPSYRRQVDLERERVMMTVEQEARMEYVIHPQGGSGQQWDAWAAMFSPRDEETGYPKRMFDPLTGAVDREVVEHWAQFDISRLVAADWERFGPILRERVRLAIGELDCFYLHRAVQRLKTVVEVQEEANRGLSAADGAQRRHNENHGYILVHPHATHGSIIPIITMRWNQEMREHLREHGLER